MIPASLQAIHAEHGALAMVLKSLQSMLAQDPGDDPQAYFDALRAMLFYIDEYPEREHHPKESQLLFPAVIRHAPELAATIERLQGEHHGGERAVRELQHLVLAWELLGESRRAAFCSALKNYVAFYLEHMRLEESLILPIARQHCTAQEWALLDAAFAENRDPLAKGRGSAPDPAFERLFQRITNTTPSPTGPWG